MAKPFDAVKVKVTCDLSEASIEDARSMICEEKAGRGHFEDGSTHEFFSSYQVLRIASQNMGVALVLRVSSSFSIDPSFTYTADEWSLHDRTFNKKTKEYDEIIIWSPGA